MMFVVDLAVCILYDAVLVGLFVLKIYYDYIHWLNSDFVSNFYDFIVTISWIVSLM